MPLDLKRYSSATKKQQIEIGQRYSSQDTLAQANQTLSAFEKYSMVLKTYGFNRRDATVLTDARDLLRLAGVDRKLAKGQKKIQSSEFIKALDRAQGARLRARSVLISTREELEAYGANVAESRIGAALAQTTTASEQAELLAVQLDILAKILNDADVVDAAKERGGPEATSALQEAAAALRTADEDNANRRGTPEETQRLDQIDGIIVMFARRARKAAHAAARDQGDPALAKAFMLDKLYKSRSNNSEPAPDDDADIDDDDDTPNDV